ncbi:MAG TPA: hypothetical protein VJM33_03525 [Microthrixaceae bacterium]|nr:hypothetical protein [Microthrixaceae bacterium]
MTVAVLPDEFRWVHFDPSEIASITEAMVTRLGLESVDVIVEVNDQTSNAIIELRELDPIRCYLESGSVEDSRRLRCFSRGAATESIGRLLIEARDRRDPAFGAPDLQAGLDVSQRVVWDTYNVGRLVRLGGRDERPRRQYLFRSRFGFSDAVDLEFERLWGAEGLTFADLADAASSSGGTS